MRSRIEMEKDRSRFEREKATLRAMIGLYCRDLHHSGDVLCEECAALLEYALARLDKCTFGADKPKCSDCTVHCYKPAMRERIRDVMRYSGPRMMVRHPVLALGHVVDGVLHRPAKPARKAS
jgi:hypothetical protein